MTKKTNFPAGFIRFFLLVLSRLYFTPKQTQTIDGEAFHTITDMKDRSFDVTEPRLHGPQKKAIDIHEK